MQFIPFPCFGFFALIRNENYRLATVNYYRIFIRCFSG